jgi:hypothetical protein
MQGLPREVWTYFFFNHFDNWVLVSLTALISKITRAKSNLFPDAFRKFRMESREEKRSKSDLKLKMLALLAPF